MNQYRDIIRRIMISVNATEGAYYIIAKKSGVKENTLSLLYALDDGKSHSQKEICEEWLIPKTTLNTIVKECIAAGYIFLDADQPGKEKMIRLTPMGQNYAKKILQQIYELEERAMERTLQSFSPEFAQAFEEFTKNLANEARSFTNEP